MSTPEVIYKKFRNGDKLTDKELDIGIDAFQKAGNALAGLGDTFRLARIECFEVASRFEGFKLARKR